MLLPIIKIFSRYDNHSPPSTTARNNSTDNQEGNERNGSANKNTQEHDDDMKAENDVRFFSITFQSEIGISQEISTN